MNQVLVLVLNWFNLHTSYEPVCFFISKDPTQSHAIISLMSEHYIYIWGIGKAFVYCSIRCQHIAWCTLKYCWHFWHSSMHTYCAWHISICVLLLGSDLYIAYWHLCDVEKVVRRGSINVFHLEQQKYMPKACLASIPFASLSTCETH